MAKNGKVCQFQDCNLVANFSSCFARDKSAFCCKNKDGRKNDTILRILGGREIPDDEILQSFHSSLIALNYFNDWNTVVERV